MSADRSHHRMSVELLVLLVVTVVAACGPALFRYASWEPAYLALVAAIVVHCTLGTLVYSRIEDRAAWHYPFLAVQTALALTILTLARFYGPASILLIPLAAQAGILLDRRAGIFYALGLIVLENVPLLILGEPFSWKLLRYSFTSGTGIFFGLLIAQLLRGTSQAKEEVERLNEDLAEANRRLQDAADQTAALATAEERNRLAREIHDSVGHALTTLHVQVDAARQVVAVDPDKARDLLEKARAIAGEGLDEVRRAVAAMRDDPTPMAIAQAIEELADKARQTGIDVSVTTAGKPKELAPEAHLTVYRAAQEALTNVRKHGTGRADIALEFDNESVRLLVRNPAADRNGDGGGFGLVGLRERAEFVRGRLSAGRRHGEFVLDLEVPAS